MSRALFELIDHERWFHAIDFGEGLVSKGRFGPDVPPNYTLYGVFELMAELALVGARVVDVGTMDGIVAFGAKARGAAEVIATDLARRETFEAGRAHLGLDIDYRVPVQALDLPALVGERKADVIAMAGVLYHVLDPIAVLVAAREAIAREGFLVVETMYVFDDGRPRMTFNPADGSSRGNEHHNVFWRPSKTALEGMLELAGFEVVASIAVDGRIATLAQAKRPSEIATRSERVRGIQRSYARYANYRERLDFRALERDEGAPSRAVYRGPRGDRRIVPAFHMPRAPFQPTWSPPHARARLTHAARSAWFHGRSLAGDLVASMRGRRP
jgi:2-polyprenyl-3-methyl-5-hydroxy-6-metoxy-1,4-benzoquinol methylase